MRKTKISKKIITIVTTIVMAISIVPITAFAAEPDVKVNEPTEKVLLESGIVPLGNFPIGDWELEACAVNDFEYGGVHRFTSGKWLQIKPAWKATDSSTSEIDMYIELWDLTTGTKPFWYRFSPSDDTNGAKDGAGYWYAESGWTRIYNDHQYQLYYEAYTTPGYSGTGHSRRGTCTVWVEVGA